MKKILLILFGSFISLHATYTVNELGTDNQNFSRIYNTKIFGKTIAIGNTVLCDKDASGNCVNNSSSNYVVDLEYVTNSEANLTIPYDNFKVLKAYLFWQGRGLESTSSTTARSNLVNASAATIKLKRPGDSSFTTIDLSTTSATERLDVREKLATQYFYAYSTYTDITDLLDPTDPQGLYTVTDLYTQTGTSSDYVGHYGAWTILFVVEDLDQRETIQDISVYNGFKAINSSTPDTITIDGFLTPLNTALPVNAELTIFVADGDLAIIGDQVSINGTSINFGGGTSNAFFSNISGDFYHNPDLTNTNAIDLHTIEVGKDGNGVGYEILGHGETEATISLTSSMDEYFASMVSFSVELYQPSFCYDYAYSQDNSYFTEDNNGSLDPSISGHVITGHPIETTIYIRNQESDLVAENAYLILQDFNTTQAELLDDGTGFKKTSPGEVQYNTTTPVSITASDFNISLATTIGSNQGVYTKFFIDPVKMSELDIPIQAYVDYEFTVDGSTIHLPMRKLTRDIPLCAQGENVYTPEWGIFNIVDRNLNVDTATNTLRNDVKYNLFTQVVRRPFEAEIVSFDATNTSQVKAMSNFIGIELFNDGYHDINSSCGDSDNAISERLWVPYLNESGATAADQEITHKYFDIQAAINSQTSSISTVEEYFSQAHENVAFRIWYMVNKDNNDTPIEFEFNDEGLIKYANFPDIAGEVCGGSIDTFEVTYLRENGTYKTTSSASVACGSAGSYYTVSQMSACAQCVIGRLAKPLCSRDNFSIRPEAFDIKLFDINHTQPLATRSNTKQELTSHDLQLAGGYPYRFEINATSHQNSNAVTGYRFSTTDDYDANITFNWEPNGHTVSGCNDTNASAPTFDIVNGAIYDGTNYNERSLNNVGRYRLSMIDKEWTKVDQDPAHHKDSFGNLLTVYNAGNGNYDCTQDQSFTPAATAALSATTIGCNISSSHTNPTTGTVYQDYNITFVPYRLDAQSFTPTYGVDSTVLGSTATLYMSDLNRSAQMAIHYSGTLQAVGENNNTLSNFVDQCYATAVNINIEHNASAASATVPAFQYSYSDTNAMHYTGGTDVTVGSTLISVIPASYFTKVNAGTLPMQIHFNFERNSSDPKEAQRINIGDFNTSCVTPSECSAYADLSTTHLPDDGITTDSNVTFYYGRAHAPRYRINGAASQFDLFYEVYCDTGNCTATGLGAESPDDVNWYLFTAHTSEATLGDANITSFISSINDGQTTFTGFTFDNQGTKKVSVTFNNNSAVGYPFKTKIDMTPSPWLVHNRFDENATTNSFMLEFYNSNSSWTGTVNTSSQVDSNASKTTNRRINW